MDHKLAGVAGPLKDRTIVLTAGRTIIGRDASSHVAVRDALVSRQHAAITVDENAKCRISDLDSANGTIVNGLPIRESLLKDGDLIQIGGSLLLFVGPEQETPVSPVEAGDELDNHSTIQLRREDLAYFGHGRRPANAPSAEPLVSEFKTLLDVCRSLIVSRDMGSFQQTLLDQIFDIIPAERAAILMAAPDSKEFVSSSHRNKVASSNRPISRRVSTKVLQEGIGILSNAALDLKTFERTESLIASRTTSLLCVPITVGQKSAGVLYVDTTDRTVRFNDGHLRVLSGIAAIAGFALDHVFYIEWLKGENERLQREINVRHDMVGDSPQIRQVYEFINRVSLIDSTVLIRGESGTGKELVARALHRNSKRADKPFVAINCAVLTDTLFESELFGHEKGAFTGAIALKKGKIEIAEGGTLFLDEIGELSPQAQAKLLRVLQEREFERVGGTRPIRVNIRLIVATNRDLEVATNTGLFRQDLYYRLNVVSTTLPPLRERRDDIPLLAVYFLHRYSKECNRPVTAIDDRAMALLKSHNWPGNIRELQNVLERAVALGSCDRILPEDLPDAVFEATNGALQSCGYHGVLMDAKRKVVLEALKQAKGNVTEAARLLDLNANYLHRLIHNLNLKRAAVSLKAD